MLSDEEIVRRLRVIKHSSQTDRRRQRGETMLGLAKSTGIARSYLHRIADKSLNMGPRTRGRLQAAFGCPKVE
jgi:hypothetical protein